MNRTERTVPASAPAAGATPADLQLDYLPPTSERYRPPLGLIGCGEITRVHLQAYRDAGYQVAALCDPRREVAEARRSEFYPDAAVYDDHRQLLARDDIEVVDIATHPEPRVGLIEAALQARKHVLSQKPFVLDLDVGERLVALAARQNVLLAVNQNGRWAPHFRYALRAVAEGWLGDLLGAHLGVHWDHTWVVGTSFEHIRHLILFDYAIHWFDLLNCLLPEPPRSVYATTAAAPNQPIASPLLAQVTLAYRHAQASLSFEACVPQGSRDRTLLVGTRGTLESSGPGNRVQQVTVRTEHGQWSPTLRGSWFPDGFRGTMGELLLSIEQGRQPEINAADNLRGLALCFAAIRSAASGQAEVPGSVRTLP